MRISSKVLLLGAAACVVLSPQSASAFLGVSEASHSRGSSFVTVSKSESQAAENFVDKMAGDAISFLGNVDLSEAQKQKKFRVLLTKSFDMSTIGRFALGRYWRTASAEQRKEYQSLFRDMIIEVYSRRFGEYDGQALEIRSSRKDSEKDVTVQSFIVAGSGQEIQVDWRVRYKNGQYKVIDVMVEGVSMALTQRSDFSSVIQRGGGKISVLIAHLREQ